MGYPQHISSIASKKNESIHQAVEWINKKNKLKHQNLVKQPMSIGPQQLQQYQPSHAQNNNNNDMMNSSDYQQQYQPHPPPPNQIVHQPYEQKYQSRPVTHPQSISQPVDHSYHGANTGSTSHNHVYFQLMNMGYPQRISSIASKRNQNIHQAIEWIMTNNDKQPQNRQEPMHEFVCNGGNILNCPSSQRITSLLKFYQKNHANHDLLGQYLEKYKDHLISDFHHILGKHLSEDTVTTQESDKQFEMMYEELKNNNINCDIGKCQMYLRNNRQRELVKIECEDKNLSMFIDIIDTIHCFFIHSIDIGYRIQNAFYNRDDTDNKDEEDMKNESSAYDAKMARLRRHLKSKRMKVERIRGKRRLKNTKFMTHTIS